MASIADILMIVCNVLQPWAAQNNAGTAVIASSVQDMWTQAYNVSDRPSVIICYAGDEARGPFELAAATHRGDFLLNIAVIRARSVTAERGAGLVSRVGNAEAFYNSLEQARDLVRSITNISMEAFVDYKGTKPFDAAVDEYGRRVDGFIIEASVAQDYPQLVNTPDNTVLPI
jgi:hypothetical protein